MPVIVINWRRLNWRLISVCTLLSTILFNEYLVYSLQSWRWFSLPKSHDPDDDVVALLVADPQIQGYKDGPPSILGTFTRWDADRYLRNTFRMVYGYVQPDVIIFLGDLLDEGSIASDQDFRDYKGRFLNIFSTSTDVERIHLAGDNDIGGEGRDFRTRAKMERFIQNFEEMTGVTHIKFVDFVRMDIEYHNTLNNGKRKMAASLGSEMTAQFRVMLSHESVLTKLKVHVHPLLTEFRPQLIISGHWHMSNQYICEDCMSYESDITMEYWPVHRRDISKVDHLVEINLMDNDAINELMIPSCNYRMNEVDVGYGVVVFKKTGVAYHGVLWLPHRYKLLYSYVAVFFALSVLPVFIQFLEKQLTR